MFQVRNSTQRSLRLNLEIKTIAITTTSASNVPILIFRMPCLDISCSCKKNSCVSLQLCTRYNKAPVIPLISDYCFITVSSKAHIISLPSSKLLPIAFERKQKNSDFFSPTRGKVYQFFTGYELFSAFLLIPFPRFFHVAAFKLFFLYISNIMSTQSNLVIYFLIAAEKISSS